MESGESPTPFLERRRTRRKLIRKNKRRNRVLWVCFCIVNLTLLYIVAIPLLYTVFSK